VSEVITGNISPETNSLTIISTLFNEIQRSEGFLILPIIVIKYPEVAIIPCCTDLFFFHGLFYRTAWFMGMRAVVIAATV